MTRIKECVLYREFEHGEILDKMTALMDACEKSAVNAREMEEDFYECVNGLIEIAGSYGFAGNLWHNYLTLLLVNNENAFSTASEIRGHIDGSINELARHDFTIFKELYDFDLNMLEDFPVPASPNRRQLFAFLPWTKASVFSISFCFGISYPTRSSRRTWAILVIGTICAFPFSSRSIRKAL